MTASESHSSARPRVVELSKRERSVHVLHNMYRKNNKVPEIRSSHKAAICADASTISITAKLAPDSAMLEAVVAVVAADAAAASRAQLLQETNHATLLSNCQQMPGLGAIAAAPEQNL